MPEASGALADFKTRRWPTPRAKLSFILPSRNTVAEPQFNGFAPQGVTIHVTRTKVDDKHDVPFADQIPEILDAARLAADMRPDILTYHCNGASMGSGVDAEKQVIDAIEKATGRRTTTTATAVMAAFKVLNIRKVVLLTPYGQASNDRLKAYLAQSGVQVLRDAALDLPRPEGMSGCTPEAWLEASLEVQHPDAEAYYYGCANIRATEGIPMIEKRLGKPAVASNQAAFWYALRSSGVKDAVEGLGRLGSLDLPN